MATPNMTETGSAVPRWIAPPWHTWALAGLFLLLAGAGAWYQHAAGAPAAAPQGHPSVAPLYLSLIALEWGLVFYVQRGLRRTGTSLRLLVGGRWRGWQDVALDVGLGAAVWVVWTALTLAWDRWLGPGHAVSIQRMLPRGPVETSLWLALSASAGFCEELVFRGYFLTQLRALTRSRWSALILQAALFGISHGYQGVTACLKIAVFGALYGIVALWRRSLRPGMIAHAWTDVAGGLFGL
jgi:membrane protease YdiL (CAAX protease family)